MAEGLGGRRRRLPQILSRPESEALSNFPGASLGILTGGLALFPLSRDSGAGAGILLRESTLQAQFCHKFGRLHVAASLRTFGGMVALVLGLKCVEGSVREIDRIHVRGGGVYGAYRTTALRQSPLCKASIACF